MVTEILCFALDVVCCLEHLCFVWNNVWFKYVDTRQMWLT